MLNGVNLEVGCSMEINLIQVEGKSNVIFIISHLNSPTICYNKVLVTNNIAYYKISSQGPRDQGFNHLYGFVFSIKFLPALICQFSCSGTRKN